MNKFIVNTINVFVVLITTMIILFVSAHYANAAQIPNTYTNENFWTSEHDAPETFTQDSRGNFTGVTVGGKSFSQRNIFNVNGFRIQKFSIDEAFYYVSNQGIIIAPNDLIAISIYFNRYAHSLG